jgi:alpha-D-xyloside xylohydrolase
MNRRQLGKGLVAGVVSGFAAQGGRTLAMPAGSARDVDPSLDWNPVAAGVWRATIGTPEIITPVRTRSVAPRLEALSAMTHVSKPPLMGLKASLGQRGAIVQLPLAANEDIYGFGLQFFSVSHRGKKRAMRVNADPHMDTGDSHAPVPFYVTSKGYGVLIDTARYATFYCGEARPKPMHSQSAANGGTLPISEAGLYSKGLQEEQGSEVIVEIPNSAGVDVYLFAGPTLLEAVRRYNIFSGGGVTPPEWGLGFWYRAASNMSDHQILALANELRERSIPCDVLGLEAGWQTHAYSCTFAWHKERFPDPPRFVKDMKAQGYRLNLWEHAFTHPSSPLFPRLQNLSGDKGVWGGLVPDFADANARAVFGGYHGEALIDLGVDGFKLDECDNSDYTGGWSFPELSRFPSGADGEQMHCLFGMRYQQALWDQFKQRKRLTYSLVRSSGALAAPSPFVLYSDLYDHRQFVRALVNSGFSGLLWCPEVRDAKSEEDLLRRLQVVVFSPLAMINGWYIPNPPWKQLDRKKNNAGELTLNWEKLEARCREILGWRMQLVPYLKATFARYATDGTPPFRALAMDWPDDAAVAKIDDAWMIGDRMLVAPLFANEPGRTLLMPPGEWHDFWSGERVHGGTRLEIPASQSKIPVFVKAGSVLPLAKIANTVHDEASRELDVRVFGDGSLSFAWDSPEYGSLQLSWDAEKKSCSLTQRDVSYTIKQWSQVR